MNRDAINATAQENIDLSGMQDKYFTFWLNEQLYAIPIENVVQIVGIQPFTKIPEAPYYMKGLVNIRGSMIPVIDMRSRLAMEEREYNDRTSIIIVSVGDNQISFIVDDVNEVAGILPEEFSPPGEVSNEYLTEYVTAISNHNEKTILHLDLSKLFHIGDFDYA